MNLPFKCLGRLNRNYYKKMIFKEIICESVLKYSVLNKYRDLHGKMTLIFNKLQRPTLKIGIKFSKTI